MLGFGVDVLVCLGGAAVVVGVRVTLAVVVGVLVACCRVVVGTRRVVVVG